MSPKEKISCWSSEIHWTLAKYIDRTSIPGIVASLSKKELIEIHDQRDPQNTWISFTAKGLEIFKQTFYYNNVYLPLT